MSIFDTYTKTYAYDKEAFLQSYVLTRVSQEITAEQLMNDALYCWNRIKSELANNAS